MLPFINPISNIWRASTCPSIGGLITVTVGVPPVPGPGAKPVVELIYVKELVKGEMELITKEPLYPAGVTPDTVIPVPTSTPDTEVTLTVTIPVNSVMLLIGKFALGLTSRSGINPTAPLYVNAPAPVRPDVAGSPGRTGTGPGYTVLKTLGNSVPGPPLAMSTSPDNGPKENMYVCVPSPIDE
jgi:hypothetical protein